MRAEINEQVTNDNLPAWDKDKLEAFAKGEITLADLEGITAEDTLEITKTGYDFLENGKLDDAAVIFMGLIALDPTNAYAHLSMATVHFRKGQFAEAAATYDRVLRINPYSDTALVNRGETLIEHGAYGLAKESLEEAIALEAPVYPEMIEKARLLLAFINDNNLVKEAEVEAQDT